MTQAKFDQNRVPSLIGVSSLDLATPTRVAVNPDTGAVLIDGTSLYANLDDRYLLEANNLSDLANVATARTNLGLVAGGTGDIWVEKAGDDMTGPLSIDTNSATALLVERSGVYDNLLVVNTAIGAVGVNIVPEYGYLDVSGWITSRNPSDTDEFITMGYSNTNNYGYIETWVVGLGHVDLALIGDNVLLRADTHDGSTKVKFVDDGNNEVASVDSDGNSAFLSAVVGDGTNQLLIGATGVVTLEGTAKRDLTLRASIDYIPIIALTKPTQVAIGIFRGFSMPIWNDGVNSNEQLFFNENVPGRWDGASDIKFHVLVALASAETAGETFKFQFSWNQVGETEVIPATTNGPTDEIIVVDGTQYATYMLEFTIDYNIDAEDLIIPHDDLVGRLRRVASTGDEVDGEVIVLDWHTHYTIDKMFKAPE